VPGGNVKLGVDGAAQYSSHPGVGVNRVLTGRLTGGSPTLAAASSGTALSWTLTSTLTSPLLVVDLPTVRHRGQIVNNSGDIRRNNLGTRGDGGREATR
jgi:hypothetical protein